MNRNCLNCIYSNGIQYTTNREDCKSFIRCKYNSVDKIIYDIDYNYGCSNWKGIEKINHPKHYNNGKIEVIDFIEDKGWGEGFNLGNAIKYICRAGYKNPDTIIEDLEKASWYLNREIRRLKNDSNEKEERY